MSLGNRKSRGDKKLLFFQICLLISLSGLASLVMGQQTWTARTSGTSNNLTSIIWADSEFVAIGAKGTIVTSPDGITWSARPSGTTCAIEAIIWGNNQFIAVGDSGTILTSSNGIQWTSSTSGVKKHLFNVAFGAGQFVAVGDSGTVISSPDGLTWTPRFTNTFIQLKYLAWGNQKFIVITSNMTIGVSSDGINWSNDTARGELYGSATNISELISNNNKFVAIEYCYILSDPYLRNDIASSSDGIKWGAGGNQANKQFNAVGWGGNQFLSIGDSVVDNPYLGVIYFVPLIATSVDATTSWTFAKGGPNDNSGNKNFNSIAVGADKYIAVGASGRISSSPLVTATVRITANKLLPKSDINIVGNIAHYYVLSDAPVVLNLFDSKGRLVKNLVNHFQAAGAYATAIPSSMPKGAYILSLQAGERRIMQKVLIVR